MAAHRSRNPVFGKVTVGDRVTGPFLQANTAVTLALKEEEDTTAPASNTQVNVFAVEDEGEPALQLVAGNGVSATIGATPEDLTPRPLQWLTRGQVFDGDINQGIGTAAAMTPSGNTIAFSNAINGDAEDAFIRVYDWDANEAQWELRGSQIDKPDDSPALFGLQVALSSDGNTLVASARGQVAVDPADVGKGYVFTWSGTAWVLDQVFEAESGQPGFEACEGVAINPAGTVVAFGWPGNSVGQGAIQVYEKSSGVWSTRGDTLSPDPALDDGDNFGATIRMSTDTTRVFVGAAGGEAVYYFVWSTSSESWDNPQGTAIQQDTPVPSNDFGKAIDINEEGTVLAVGEPGFTSGTGRVSLWELDEGAWQKRIATDLEGTDTAQFFGNSVALNSYGDLLFIRAPAQGTDGQIYAYGVGGINRDAFQLFGEPFESSGKGSTEPQPNTLACSSSGRSLVIGDGLGVAGAGRVQTFRGDGSTLAYLVYKLTAP